MSNRNATIKAIFAVDSIDDLRDINLALKQRWSELESRGVLNFKVGDSVKFTSRKRGCRRGGVQIGVVTKINRKTVSVLVGNIPWRVTPSVLSPLHKKAA